MKQVIMVIFIISILSVSLFAKEGYYNNCNESYSYGYFIANPIDNIGLKVLNIITFVMMTISVIATIFSGYDYIKNGKDLFKEDTK